MEVWVSQSEASPWPIQLFKEGDAQKRQEHIAKLIELKENGEITIFQDECGIQEDLVRDRGRIQDKNNKSQKLYGQKTAIKHIKTGLISGYVKLSDHEQYKYIAPMIFNFLFLLRLVIFYILPQPRHGTSTKFYYVLS